MKKQIYSLLAITSLTIVATISSYAQPGTLDNSFDFDGKAITTVGLGDDWGNAIALQSDGKIVVVGSSQSGSFQRFAVVRYNIDGSLDNTFDTDGMVTTDIGSYDDIAYSVAIQSDGKIVVAGSSPYSVDLVRYNSDGSLDNTFDTDGIVTTNIGTNGQLLAVAIQTDGKIVAGGYADNGSDYDFVLVRYNTNGSIDNTFDTDGIATVDFFGGRDDYATAMLIQPDGKIIISGTSHANPSEDFTLARFNSNGSLDNSFDTDGKVSTDIGVNTVDNSNGITLQVDGKILLTGHTDTVDVSSDFVLLRYNSDGGLDYTFDSDGIVITPMFFTGMDRARDVAVQNDGRIVVAGFGGGYALLARYDSNGALDLSFDTDGLVQTSSIETAFACAIQNDGKILVAGTIVNSSYPDIVVLRYNGDPLGISENSFGNNISAYPNPTNGIINISANNPLNNASVKLVDAIGQICIIKQNISGSNFSFDISEHPNGTYFLEITEGVNITTIKVVK